MCVRAPAVLKGGRRQRRGGLIESLTSAVGSTSSHRCSLRQHHRLRTSSTACCAHDSLESLRLLCSLSFLKVVARQRRWKKSSDLAVPFLKTTARLRGSSQAHEDGTVDESVVR